MKKSVAVIAFRATQDDIDALTAIQDRMRDSGHKKFATRADCMRIALAHALTLLKQPAAQNLKLSPRAHQGAHLISPDL